MRSKGQWMKTDIFRFAGAWTFVWMLLLQYNLFKTLSNTYVTTRTFNKGKND